MNRPACPFLRSAPTENSREARPETGKNHYLASAPPYPGPQETYLYMDPYTLFENMLAADTARLASLALADVYKDLKKLETLAE